MAKLSYKTVEVGQSYIAMIWRKSVKEPVEVKILNRIHEAHGLRIVTDKFDLVQQEGYVIHSESGDRVTFRHLRDAPLLDTPKAAPKPKAKREDSGWNIPPAGAIIRPTRADTTNPMLPAEGSANNTRHVLIAPNGLETCWTWLNGEWIIGVGSNAKPPKFMALAGYTYVRPE